MRLILKWFVAALKKIDLASAAAVRLTKATGKSKVPIHPKHLLSKTPWFTRYIEKNDAVLDLGCGNGQNSIKAAKFAKKVIGVDYDESSLALAKKSALRKNISFKKINLERPLPFKNSSFDKILFLDVLEHLNHRNQVLEETRRVLVAGGLLFLAVPNSQTSWKKLQRAAGICSYSDPDHKIEFSQKSIEKLLAKHHCKILHLGFAPYDTPLRGLFDLIGSFSLSLYKFFWQWRLRLAQKNPHETVGFEIVAQNQK